MHSPEIFSTGVHPICPGASADNPTHGYRIRELEDFTAEFRQQSRCDYIYTLGEYIYCMIQLCGLLIYDQQNQLRRRTNDYSAKFTPNPMVWQACNFFLELVATEQSYASGDLRRGGADCAHTNQPDGLLQTAGRATVCCRDHDRVLDLSPAARPGSFRTRAISVHFG